MLVGGVEHGFYFSIQLGMSSSQLTKSIIFQRGRLNHQPDMNHLCHSVKTFLSFWGLRQNWVIDRLQESGTPPIIIIITSFTAHLKYAHIYIMGKL